MSPELVHVLSRYAAEHRLSPRETTLLQMTVAGLTNDEAAAALRCARPTVATYWNRIFAKVGRRSQRDVISSVLLFALAWRFPEAGKTDSMGRSSAVSPQGQA